MMSVMCACPLLTCICHLYTGCEISETLETLNETTPYIIQAKDYKVRGAQTVYLHTYVILHVTFNDIWDIL